MTPRHPSLLPAAAVIGLVSMMALPPARAQTVSPIGARQDTSRMVSAALLQRIAAAADGYRTGEPVWVVASYRFPHTVAHVFSDPSRARAVRDSLGGGEWDVFGPILTPPDFGAPEMVTPCVHGRPTMWYCDPTLTPPWRVQDVDSVSFEIFHRSGRTWRLTRPGLALDAAFLTLSAADKFAFPYYAGLFGVDYAAAMRDSLAAYVRSGQ